MPHQPASLHLLGQPALDCVITDISKDQINLETHNTLKNHPFKKGDIADILVSNIQLDNAKIRATIAKVDGSTILLSCIDSQSPTLKLLVDSFTSPFTNHINNEQEIIQELYQISIEQLSSMLNTFFEEADHRLLHRAENSSNNTQKNKLYEVKNLLRQYRNDIQRHYFDFIKARFNHHTQPLTETNDSTPPPTYENLELIDLVEFEDWLSLNKIIKIRNGEHSQAILYLKKRYRQLSNQKVTDDNFPVSIQNLCRALKQALKKYSLDVESLLPVYRIYDESLASSLGGLYHLLNSCLKRHGILSDIESTLPQELIPEKISSNPNKNNTNPSDHHPEGTPNNKSSEGTELYSTVTSILSLLQTSNTENSTAAPHNDQSSIQQPLLDTLTSLQANQKALSSIAKGESLQHWIKNNSSIQLHGEIENKLQLINDIFNKINHYPKLPSSVIYQLKRLEIPIAKVALLDNSFFSTSSENPAKSVLNQLMSIYQNTDLPNQALEKKIDTIISLIINNYLQDTRVFQQALTHILEIDQHQKDTYQRNLERLIQTCAGKETIQQAQKSVEREIQRRLPANEAPEIIIELINNGWRELLTLTYIKTGTNSEDWLDHLATLDQLFQRLKDDSPDKNSSQSITQREVNADSFVDSITHQLDTTFPASYRHQATIKKLRYVLKSHDRIIKIPLDNSNDSKQKKSKEDSNKNIEASPPQLSRWFKRAKDLRPGDEFSYLNKESIQSNITLAWIDQDLQQYIFVNSLGQKILELNLAELAIELSQGLFPIEQQSKWSHVENSFHSTTQQAYQQLSYKSSHDDLTGLLNRKECENILNKAIIDVKYNSKQHCLLYLDIDQFSIINNLHGHEAGDQLLIAVSDLLTLNAPKDSIISRMAGNEFAILLKQQDINASKLIAEKLCRCINQFSFEWRKNTLQFTISIGLIPINMETEDVVTLLKNAVFANQTAKNNGGNRVYKFRPNSKLQAHREKMLSWIDKFNKLFDSGRLVLRGQKICALSESESHLHYEILLAVKDDNGELTPPNELIEAAEFYNKMQGIDRWVIENTLEWLSRLSDDNIELPSVSINLSGNSLNDDHFIDFILNKFKKYKTPTHKICFEITETATINNLTEAANFIREIKKLGCKFALDDFGSGNASYQYLKHLPVDYLKIDGMYVKDIENNKHDYSLVKSMHEIAHLMGKKTIAEYVENDAISDMLKNIGIDYGQGYAIGMPTLLSQLYTKAG